MENMAPGAINQGNIHIGDKAPNFQAESSKGRLDFYNAIEGHWAILFSHPADFTPVCTTELSRVAQLSREWAERNVCVIALSCDSVQSHLRWLNDVEDVGNCKVNYPVIADEDRKIATQWGMLDRDNIQGSLPLTVRSVFIIDTNKKVRLIQTYPASTGRNFDEILRCVDSLQLASKHKVATPVDWVQGEECIIPPTVSDADAAKTFSSFKTLKPYLRLTNPPLWSSESTS